RNSPTASETPSHAARPTGTHHHALMCLPRAAHHLLGAYRPLMIHCTTGSSDRQGDGRRRGLPNVPLSVYAHVMPGSQLEAVDLLARLVRDGLDVTSVSSVTDAP